MTIIIAIENEDETVTMGCDSFMGDASVIDEYDSPKFFEKAGMLIGFAGGLRIPQILNYSAKIRKIKRGEDVKKYLVTHIVTELKKEMKTLGEPSPGPEPSGGTPTYDSVLLIGIKGQLYIIQDDFSVIRSSNGVAAIGAGAPYALGAYYAIRNTDMTPRDKVELILNATVANSPQCAGPFYIGTL